MAETGNPDEITLEQEPRKQQQHPPPTNQNAQQGPVGNMPRPPAPNPAVVTPSKPERSWTPAPAPRPAAPNGPNHMTHEQRRPGPAPGPQNLPNPSMAHPPQYRSSQDTISQAAGGQPGAGVGDNRTQGMIPPSSSPSVDGQRHAGASSAAFFSARAVDMLRDNPQPGPSAAPQFDPHTESPSIRKTAGVDHTKSVPISKPMIAGASPATNHSRDFINPSSDMHRKIGAPGGSGVGSPLNRGQSTSSYRPLTRPNVDQRPTGMGMGNAAAPPPPPGRGSFAPQNANGKRPPLSDVTNGAPVSGSSGPAPRAGVNDLKKPRFDEGTPHPAPQQQFQQQQQHQQQQQQQQPPQQR